MPLLPHVGDAGAGRRLLHGHMILAGEDLVADGRVWVPAAASDPAVAALNGFDWLADLRALGGDEAVHHGRWLINHWLQSMDQWHPLSWRADATGARIANWLGHFSFFLASAEDSLVHAVLRSLMRQTRHLVSVGGRHRDPTGQWAVARGLLFASVCLCPDSPLGRRARGLGLKVLDQALADQILPDGGHVSRAPHRQLAVLRDLMQLRALLAGPDQAAAERCQRAVDAMALVLRLYRHGDGALAMFNGSTPGASEVVEGVLRQCGAGTKPLTHAPQAGYHRLAARNTVVIVDAGTPPPVGFAAEAHGAPLAFEMSSGGQRLVVNCGPPLGLSADWELPLRGTAAHSTLTVDDTNSVEVTTGGRFGRRPEEIAVLREDGAGQIWLEAEHDGYAAVYGLYHRRRLYLAGSGGDLRGEDTLRGTGQGGLAVTVRFHLHPAVEAVPARGGSEVHLFPPTGETWRLIADGTRPTLTESVYVAAPGQVQRSQQVVLHGVTRPRETVFKWRLARLGGAV